MKAIIISEEMSLHGSQTKRILLVLGELSICIILRVKSLLPASCSFSCRFLSQVCGGGTFNVELEVQPPHFPITWSYPTFSVADRHDLRHKVEASCTGHDMASVYKRAFLPTPFKLFILTLPQESQLKNWPF